MGQLNFTSQKGLKVQVSWDKARGICIACIDQLSTKVNWCLLRFCFARVTRCIQKGFTDDVVGIENAAHFTLQSGPKPLKQDWTWTNGTGSKCNMINDRSFWLLDYWLFDSTWFDVESVWVWILNLNLCLKIVMLFSMFSVFRKKYSIISIFNLWKLNELQCSKGF